jgi:hypothetical protein
MAAMLAGFVALRSKYSPESRLFQGSRHIFGWIIGYLIEIDSLR